MNDNDRLLKYSDIVLVPRFSDTITRRDIDVSVQLGRKQFELPVVPANMRTVIDEKLAWELSENNYFYTMHRFDIDVYNFVLTANQDNWQTISISIGVKPDDHDLLWHLSDNDLRVDYITVDIAHGHSLKMLQMINRIRELYPDVHLIAGNVATKQAVIDLANAGADSVKVGIGQGSPCTTKDKTGFTMPMYSCLMNCMEGVKAVHQTSDRRVTMIADGGIKCNGDIAKALTVDHVSMVMIGGMFAQCIDSPAETVTKTLQTGFFKNEPYRQNYYSPEYHNKRYKRYYGSASVHNKGHNNNIEGVLREMPCNDLTYMEKLHEIEQDLQSSISYAGGSSVVDLRSARWRVI